MTGFLTVDEIAALDRMIALTRSEARDVRDAATSLDLYRAADLAQGIVSRHRALVLRSH